MDEKSPDQQIDLRRYIGIVVARKWTIIITVLVVVAAVLFLSFRETPVYTSSARVLVTALPSGPNDFYVPPPNLETESEVAASEPVATRVQKDLGLTGDPRSLLGHLKVATILDSDVLIFSYTSPEPALAQQSAESFAENYIKYRIHKTLRSFVAAQQGIQKKVDDVRAQIKDTNARITAARQSGDLTQAGSLETSRGVLIDRLAHLQQRLDDVQPDRSVRLGGGSVIEQAKLPSSPSSPNHKLNALLGLTLGLAIGIALAFLRERLVDTFRSRSDVVTATQAPVLAAIPSFRPNRERILDLATLADPKGSAAEAYRSLRTSFQFLAMERGLKTVLVTSASAGEGKTVTSANLSIALAQAGSRVVLVSADLRRPTVDRYFGIHEKYGLSDWLLGRGQDVWPLTKMPPGIANLRLLPSGRVPPNPAELLSSTRLPELIGRLSEHSDFVIFDSPPSLPVADASILASQLSGTILVIDSSSTRRTTAIHAAEELRRMGGDLLGTVLNSHDPQAGYSYYDTYYTRTYYGPNQDSPNGNGKQKKKARRKAYPFGSRS
jgi:succinoglycan biosynthesis transport protein ExoP